MADGQRLKPPPGFRDPSAAKPPPPMGPRKPAMPPSFYQTKSKRRSCCRCCCCFFCCFILLVVVLLALFIGLFYVWYQPKLPVFRIREMELDKFNVKPKQDGSALLDAKVVFRVEINNRNTKLKIYYGKTSVSLTADQETDLGRATVPEFKQPANNVTVLKFTAEVDDEVVDKTTASGLQSKVKSQDVVVNAAVKTKVGIGVGSWKIGMLLINVDCGGVTLKQINDGNSSPKCSLHTLRLINIH